MKNVILSITIICLATHCLLGQSAASILKENAVNLGNLDTLSDEVYDKVKPFDLIMIGEMHGTNEPATLTYQLAKKIAEKEALVFVGIEVPKNKINLERNEITHETLLNTSFFKEDNIDGRNGTAWFDLILNCALNDKIRLFFIDNDTTLNKEIRDSIMYLEIKKIKTSNTDTKIITLTGNIHNWLIPFRGVKKMGNFINTDTATFDSTKIMSINHVYNEGTMMNNTGAGLELKIIEGRSTIYATTVTFENYLCKTIVENQGQYNFFFYTSKVSHSKRITER